MAPPEVNRISETFTGSTVFLSGGTGFVGKLLIERLLHKTQVKKIFLLVRAKKGKNPVERLQDIFSNVVFDELKKSGVKYMERCQVVVGDVTKVDLGISQEDRRMLEDQVEMIYHSAASTRFDDSLEVAVRMNTRGTKYMLELAQKCKKLKVFVHVSTAYAFPGEKILYEQPYTTGCNVDDIIKRCEEGPVSPQETKKILGDSPNTYTFSKALAEQLVAAQRGKLPVIIARPSLVTPTYKYPVPGWFDNMHGIMGMFAGAGKGVIRSMYVKKDLCADFICADVVVNGLMAFVWQYLTKDPNKWVINLVMGSQMSLSWESVIETGKDVIYNNVPFNLMAWYPGGSLVESKFLYLIYFVLFQVIPAFFYDALLMMIGYKPALVSVQRKIFEASGMLEYFTTRPWIFTDQNLLDLHQKMNEAERKEYFTSEPVDVKQYLIKSMIFARRYMKEPDEDIPKAKRTLFILWILDMVVKSLLVGLLLYFLYCKIF